MHCAFYVSLDTCFLVEEKNSNWLQFDFHTRIFSFCHQFILESSSSSLNFFFQKQIRKCWNICMTQTFQSFQWLHKLTKCFPLTQSSFEITQPSFPLALQTMEIGEENHKNGSSITLGWCAKTQNQNIYLIHWQAGLFLRMLAHCVQLAIKVYKRKKMLPIWATNCISNRR